MRNPPENQSLLQIAVRITEAVRSLPQDPQLHTKPHALIVGGFVRDLALHKTSKDLDIEVYGVTPEKLEQILSVLFPGQILSVGKAFGVLRLQTPEGIIDIASPRRESKIRKGHAGFAIHSDPDMTLEEAARRRDFSINAMSFDPLTEEFFDPFHGKEDLEARKLRIIDPERFQDDPLRVYRAIQFAARFELTVSPTDLDLMRSLVARGDMAELAPERITDELRKLFLQAERPSIGLTLARDLGLIERDYPELQALIGTPQEPEWHPEGDVWIHTLMVVDQAANLIRRKERGLKEEECLSVVLGSLCHDFGKPTTTQVIEGRIRSRGHEEAGEAPTRSFFHRLTFSQDLVERVLHLVKDHLKPGMLWRALEKKELTQEQYINAVRKLLKRISPASWRAFLAVTEADARGRGIPGAQTNPYLPGELFAQTVIDHQLDVTPLQPLLQGKDLLSLGISPGPNMGHMIEQIENLRDEGRIKTKKEALDKIKEWMEE